MPLSKYEIEYLKKQLKKDKLSKLEIGLFEVLWSEHCSYKSSKRFLKKFNDLKSEWVVVGLGENAGVVDIGDGLGIAFKIESHNHPSAVDPFNGAATGVGGIIRDILSLGAKPIGLLDSLRFGLPKSSKRHIDGVVSGISFYGNCIGVPTGGGEVYFEEEYKDLPLVNVMAVGVLKLDRIFKARLGEEGSSVVLIGASTGRDGIGGAAFASEELDEEKRSAVQIGDPFFEKLLINAVMDIVNLEGIYGMQDLGAGGLGTAFCELAQKSQKGVEIYLDKVPLREEDMKPWEILLSESQERFLICVGKDKVKDVKNIAAKWGINFAEVGKVIKEKVVKVLYKNNILTEIPLKILDKGPPEVKLPMKTPKNLEKFKNRIYVSKNLKGKELKNLFLKTLDLPNLKTKRWIWEQYDYMVQGNTIIGPGDGDAMVVRIRGTRKAIALTVDGNSRYVFLDPYEGGKIAVCEARRNLISIGARPLGITDCLNFASPEDPETYWYFAKTVEGIFDAAKFLQIPVISGNVSFYNEKNGKKVLPTPVIGMVGVIDNFERVKNMAFKKAGDLVYMVGKMKGNIGGSEFLKILKKDWKYKVDEINLDFEKKLGELILNNFDLFESVHDISEGGLIFSIVECAIKGKKGFKSFVEGDEIFWFGEWQSRFLISLKNEDKEKFEKILSEAGVDFTLLGEVTDDFILKIDDDFSISLENVREFLE